MNRPLAFLIFFLLLLGMDIYVFQGFKVLVRRWAPSYGLILNWIYWLVPIGLTVALFLIMGNAAEPRKSKAFMWLGTALMTVFLAKFAWLIFMVVDDVIRLFMWGKGAIQSKPSPNGITRSEFIVSTGAVVAGFLFSSLTYGIVRGAHNYKVLKRKMRIKGLPKSFDGFRIVQISDVHSGSFWSKDSVKKGIDLILEQQPDAIFFTGDLVNNAADEFDEFLEIFGKLHAPNGVYSVLGNHDYGDYVSWPDKQGVTKEENLERLIQHHKTMGWDILMNEHRLIEKGGEKLAILGVENWSAHARFPKYGSLSAAHQGVEDIPNKLLLSHDPSHWRAEVLTNYPDIKGVFSGHTHGMQFGIDTKYYRWSPVKYQYNEWADLYEENGQYLYVNRGFGYIGYPGRVGFYPEISVIELESA